MGGTGGSSRTTTRPSSVTTRTLWVDRLHGGDVDGEELLGVFEPLRAANVALWRRTPEDRRARVGLHAERGPESYDLSFRMIAGHDRFHLAQARRAVTAVRS